MNVPSLAVVLLCVLGAGAVVTVVAAFGRNYLSKQEAESPPRDWTQTTPEQESYMKRVRDMNHMGIVAQVRYDRRQARNSAATGLSAFHEATSSYGYPNSTAGMDSASGYAGYGGYGGRGGVESSPLRYNSGERTGSWAGHAV